MESKHLSTGSTCPSPEPGLLRCYSMKFCPFAQRTRIVLEAKNVKYETINVHLRNKPEWLFKVNPLGKVPALEMDGKIMYESLITCDYLDEAYPEPPLYPKDPWEKAHDRVFMELWLKVTNSLFRFFYAKGDEEKIAKAIEGIEEGLGIFEAELAQRGTKFYGGEKPGMLDYMIWPWIERVPLMQQVASGAKLLLPATSPKLCSWKDEMMKDPAVMATYIPPEYHLKYLMSSLSGNPDYDMVVPSSKLA